MKTTGTKYEATKHLDTAGVTALIRADIKTAVKAGELPAGKYSVRAQTSTNSAMVVIRISGLAGEVFDRNFLRDAEAHFEACRQSGGAIYRHTAPIRAMLAKVKAMASAYNREDSDSQSDYYNDRFLLDVDVNADPDAAREALGHGTAAVATLPPEPKALPIRPIGWRPLSIAGLAAAQGVDLRPQIRTRQLALVPAPAPVVESDQERMLREMGVL